jgi:hypothetical protein
MAIGGEASMLCLPDDRGSASYSTLVSSKKQLLRLKERF